ncbi:MAG TPA: Hpt domain-containing protein [Anaerovoracaceae bacterium]|nr:Hpt domain-containing protein [Anaerovoracaceae bacterium]
MYKHKDTTYISQQDRSEAIARLGGNENLYNKYIKRFQIGYSDSDKLLYHLIEMKRYEEAQIFAHSIKGLAATLGLKDLQARSESIETAIKKGRYADLPLLLCYFEYALSKIIQSKTDQSFSDEGTGLSGLK